MALRYKLKTAPLFNPVTIAELKRNLRIPTTDTDTDRDALLTDLLLSATQRAQSVTGRQFARATYTLYLDSYPASGGVDIDLGPVAAISSVKYYAQGASTLTTITSTLYQLDNSELTARLLFLDSFEPEDEKLNPIEIEYTAGWSTAAEIPADVKDAIILIATDRFINPGNESTKTITAAEKLLGNYKVQRY
jgi:uncharacterized phiE125 gp8 family phage protein